MSSYQSAKVEIERLVEKFSKDYQRFTNPNYNEEQVRVEFINPFFRALGWDVENSLQVIHEDRVIVDDAGEKRVKHPDYGFRTGRDIRFYVEAKKPAVKLQSNPEPAYQVRRYGWSRSLPLSILTDFEEFIIYNCLEKPALNDAPHVARLSYVTYDKYPDAWDDLYGVFSQEAVLDGALERYVDDNKPKGTVTVDTAFLQELERWRELLAKDIALRNPRLTRRQLNIAVQRTIDRLVFLRITEDRNIEPYGRLNRIAQNRDDVYDGLKRLYAEANDKYNSGLFHFTDNENDEVGDPVSLKIEISGDTLKSIITNLYYPYSPYEFSVLPSDILGQVYERFLGSVIVLDGGSATIEEKPEVRKAGGVYYTPTYIVDYIVENTVGKLVENKNPNQVADLRILDPACGSGSFLIGAYQYLLDWHLDYYVDRIRENPNSTYKNRVRETDDPSQSYALTTDEKKRILLNNIYGVDLDQQAVEVSKLSLLLKMLENETASSTTQYAMFGTDEQLLPDLADNIKWGNSLIGSDFYSGKQIPMFDDEEIYRVKAFDWDSEDGFKNIMRDSGFDAVIGNPPYIRIQTMKETAPKTVAYYSANYQSAQSGNYDIYVVFVERGLELINKAGLLGFILPHKFFNAKYGANLRELIANNNNLSQVVYFGDEQVFDGATTYTCLLFLAKSVDRDFEYILVDNLEEWQIRKDAVKGTISQNRVSLHDWNFVVGNDADLFYKLADMPHKLGDVTDRIFQGLITGADKVFILELHESGAYSNQTEKYYSLEDGLLHPLCKGSVNLKRYFVDNITKVILFPYQIKNGKAVLLTVKELETNYPLTWQYLLENRQVLENRERGKWNHENWYAFGRTQNLNEMEQTKILTPSIANKSSFTLDRDEHYYFVGSGGGGGGGYGVTLHANEAHRYEYLVGLLNSNLLDFFLKKISSRFRGGYYAYNRQYIEQIPICTIDFDNPVDTKLHNKIVELVQTMLDLHKQLPELSGAQKRLIEQQIARTDREIDTLVYELYGLTDEEIAIVEEASK